MSQSRNSARRFAALSILCVRDAPHPLHRHLVAPELVCPLRFIVEPHALQIGLFHSLFLSSNNFFFEKACPNRRVNRKVDTHSVRVKVGASQLIDVIYMSLPGESI